MRIGQHTTQADLDDDWMMTHELVHMAFPSLPDDQHWMEEGLSTYVEPVARVQTGELKAEYQPNSSTGGPGDKLHPNRAGYMAMGLSVDPKMIVGP